MTATAVSGDRRYRPNEGEALEAEAMEELVRREGGWELINPERYREMSRLYRDGLLALEVERANEREPGWRVPAEQRNRWAMYVGEAVTFTTQWGPVTLGRSLARIYDLDGWPDAGALQALAEQQATPPSIERN